VLLAHDFEGFVRELEEYGAWHPPAQEIVRAARQANFFRELA
jgi:hypothetical protein